MTLTEVELELRGEVELRVELLYTVEIEVVTIILYKLYSF